MSISHKKAFELLIRGMHARLRYGISELRIDRLQGEALAGLDPDQGQELQDHWVGCEKCTRDLALYTRLRWEFHQRWPVTIAPRLPVNDALHALQVRRRISARFGWLLSPLRLALVAVLFLGAILALSWILNSLRPSPAVLPGVSTPSVLPGSTTQPDWTTTPPPTPVESQLDFPKKPLKPLMPGGILDMGLWSPDSRYLPIIQLKPSTDTRSDRVYTYLNFLDVQTGEICQAGESLLGSQLGRETMGWLQDGRLLVSSINDLYLYKPCSSETENITGLFDDKIKVVNSTNGKGQRLVLTGDRAYWIFNPDSGTAFPLIAPTPNPLGADHVFWSPSAQAIAISQPVESGSRISLVDIQSGQLLEQIPILLGTAEFAPWIDWILEDVLLVYGGPDQSSVLVGRQPGGPARLTSVLKEIFGLDVQPPAMLTAEGSFGDPQRGNYHLVLAYRSEQARALYLYHSDGNRVEKLPHDLDSFLIFPDSEVVNMFRLEDTPTYTDKFQLVWVDDPLRQPRVLVVQGHTPRQYPQLMYAWMPGTGRMAFGSTQGVSLVSIDDGRLIEFWNLEGAENNSFTDLALSPDGKTLVAKAQLDTTTQLGPESILYVIQLPP